MNKKTHLTGRFKKGMSFGDNWIPTQTGSSGLSPHLCLSVCPSLSLCHSALLGTVTVSTPRLQHPAVRSRGLLAPRAHISIPRKSRIGSSWAVHWGREAGALHWPSVAGWDEGILIGHTPE